MKRWAAVVVGIGFLHRLLYLGARQLWTDELMQARIIQFASPSQILTRLKGGMDLASPLDFFVQRGITLILGDAAWALRLHAVIFGTLSIWVFFRLARFLFGDRVAVYSSVLFAFFPLAYHYSQEGRPYALLLLLSLLSYDLLLRQLYGEGRSWRGWVLLAATSTLLLYTSYLGILIIISQLAGLIVSATRKMGVPGPEGESVEPGSHPPGSIAWRQVLAFAAAALAALAFFAPWIWFTWARPGLAPASEIVDPKIVLRLIKEIGDNSYPMAGLLLIGAITGVRALNRHRQHGALVWLLTWFAVAIPVVLAIELWAGYFFAIRHILHATPPLVLLAGYGLSHVGERLTILPHLPYQLSSPAIIFAFLLVAGSIWIGRAHSQNEPADWLGTSTYLSHAVREGDALSMPGVYPLLEYYNPGLAVYRSANLDPGAGSPGSAVQRRIVVCYDHLFPDPCATFRPQAQKDPAWMKRDFKGFKVFLRPRPTAPRP